jgi:hypothetical protein
LIEGDARATGSGDASTGGFSESHSGNIDFGHIEDSLVISDGSNNDGNFLAIIITVMLDVLTYLSLTFLMILDMDTGGLEVREAFNLLRTVLENPDSLLLARKVKS